MDKVGKERKEVDYTITSKDFKTQDNTETMLDLTNLGQGSQRISQGISHRTEVNSKAEDPCLRQTPFEFWATLRLQILSGYYKCPHGNFRKAVSAQAVLSAI